MQNFGRKNPKASMPKPSRTKHMQNIEDRLYSDEELQVKHRSKTRGATAPQNERRSKTPKSRQPSVSSEEA